MQLANDVTLTTADAMALNAIGSAIFAEWYPHHRPGDPVPPHPPCRVTAEARELGLRHRMTQAKQRGHTSG